MENRIKHAAMMMLLVVIGIEANACIPPPPGVQCANGLYCPEGTQCAGDLTSCIETGGCGNALIGQPLEECDDGNLSSSDECVTVSESYQCRRSRCGDGIVASTAVGVYHEECDGVFGVESPGPVETPTCNLDCTMARCGDGKVNGHAAELCDDNNTVNGDGCDSNCTPTGCGNGIVTASEQCDDGNSVDGDGCNHHCMFE